MAFSIIINEQNIKYYSLYCVGTIIYEEDEMEVFNTIMYVLIGVAKFFGMLVFGLGLGWMMIDAYLKNEKAWQVQATFLVGLFALLIVLALHVHVALAGFGLGFGVAVFLWGLPKKPKKED
jgi:hypothetical protein